MAKRARIIVVGCSMFGTAVARALSGAGHDVIAVDMQEGALDALGDDFDGEIITGDGKSAQVLEEWQDSPAHNENLLRENFNGIGVGVAKVKGEYYYCQLFVQR